MITFQEIYDVLRKEKYNEALQQLPKGFLEEIAAYIAEKRAILEKQESGLFSETLRTTRKQLDNTMTMIKELMTIRQRKVFALAFTAAQTGVSKRDSEQLLEHEQELFETVVRQLERCQKALNEKLECKARQARTNILVRFKESVPIFLDAEGNELGPFKQEDIANLPEKVAAILIAEGKATAIEGEKI